MNSCRAHQSADENPSIRPSVAYPLHKPGQRQFCDTSYRTMQAPFPSPMLTGVRGPREQRPDPEAAGTPASGAGFRRAFAAAANQAGGELRAPVSDYQIRAGDTLSAIARERLQQLGAPTGNASIARAVQELARTNGIENPDLIYAGQTLKLGALSAQSLASSAGHVDRLADSSASSSLVGRAQHEPVASFAQARISSTLPVGGAPALPGATLGRDPGPGRAGAASFPQLEKTLDRAVERGYIGTGERTAVHDRIVELSRKYRFSPDDFATVALMESDGLNPRANNGRCHGIIQFCEGPGRGAASVGMQGRAQDIGSQSVLEQIDLVDRYFEDTGLKDMGAVSLVDLYLTVLTPAARSERRPNVALGIAGPQASVLHRQGDRSLPLTRDSIFAGLHAHANQRLNGASANAVAAPPQARSAPIRGWQLPGGGGRIAALESPSPVPATIARSGRQG